MINFEVVKYPGQPSTATPIPPAVVVFGHGGICPVSPSGGSKLFDDQEESDSDHVIAMSDTSDGHGKEVYQCDDHDYGTLPPLSLEDKEICTEHELEMIMDRLSYSDTVTIVANKAAVGDTHAVERLKRLCVDNLIDFEVVEYAGQPSTATPRPPVVFGAGSSCPPSLSSPPAASPSGGSKLSINKDPPIPVSIKDLSNPVTIMNDQSDPIDQSDNVIAKSGSSEPSTATPRTPAVVVFGAGAICPPSPQAASPSGGSC